MTITLNLGELERLIRAVADQAIGDAMGNPELEADGRIRMTRICDDLKRREAGEENPG